jgi:hypothetical protein
LCDTNPRQGGIDPLRTELAHRLVLARTVEEIDDLLEEAECWLRKRPYDEDVRVASEAATERRVRLLADAQKREGGFNPGGLLYGLLSTNKISARMGHNV